jgi:hypothetical protein
VTTVFVSVVLTCLIGVMPRMGRMAVGCVGMVGNLLVVAILMMFGGFAMMSSGMLMMLWRLCLVHCSSMLRQGVTSLLGWVCVLNLGTTT